MHTIRNSVPHRLLTLLAALLLLLGSASSVFAQATPDASPTAGGAGPELGDAIVLHDSSGDETIQLAATQLVDPDDEPESGDRGFHWVGLELVVDNPTDTDFEFNTFGVSVVDNEGFAYNQGFASRSPEDQTARPDFSETSIPAGESASGWLFYQVINDAEPAWIIFNDTFGSQQFAVLANLKGVEFEDGQEIPFYDANAEEIGTVSADEIITDFQDLDSQITPNRGMTAVGIVLTISATGDTDLQPNSFSFYVVDDFGYSYYPEYFFRGDESMAQYPDLPSDPIPAGESVTGVVFYQIPRDAQISYVTYQPDFTQFYIVAQPGPGSTVSGDTLTPVAVPTSDSGDDSGDDVVDEETPDDSASTGEETGECVGVSAWAKATNENVAFIEDLFADVESIGDVDPDDLHDAAEQLRDAASAQEDVDVPEIAQETNDAVLAMLEGWADVFDGAADRLESGDDPADIEEDLGNDPAFGQVFNDLYTAMIALSEACPASDVTDLLG